MSSADAFCILHDWFKKCKRPCVAGDVHVQTNRVAEAVFINWGDNPFKLIKDSVKYVQLRTRICSFYDFCLEFDVASM